MINFGMRGAIWMEEIRYEIIETKKKEKEKRIQFQNEDRPRGTSVWHQTSLRDVII